MERVRPPQHSDDSAPETIGPLPSTHSLAVLLNVVRAPGVLRTDVDALLQGLARPLAEDESPRSRADFLLSLIESNEVSDMVGSNGTPVRAAAVRSLLDMGYPYALEIPPEAFGGRRAGQDADLPQELPIPGLIATLAGFITQSITCVPAVLEMLGSQLDSDKLLGLFLLVLLLGPTLSSVLGGALRMQNLQKLGVITMMITGALWLIVLAMLLGTTWNPLAQANTYIALVAGLGFLLGAFLTRTPKWLAEDEPPPEEAPDAER